LRTRIDLVLYRGSLHARRAQVLGSQPFEGDPPLWASDHAGVAATLSLGCHNRHRAVVQRR
jgi:endonuclease/exonuclease/phosphatase family metal-dependent hydrolase